MSNDGLMAMLAIAAGRREGFNYEPHKGHEGDLYGMALDEIERLRRLITEWADAADAYREAIASEERSLLQSPVRHAVIALRKAVGR